MLVIVCPNRWTHPFKGSSHHTLSPSGSSYGVPKPFGNGVGQIPGLSLVWVKERNDFESDEEAEREDGANIFFSSEMCTCDVGLHLESESVQRGTCSEAIADGIRYTVRNLHKDVNELHSREF